MSAASTGRAAASAHRGREIAAPIFLLTRQDEVDDGLAREAAGLGYQVRRVALLATEPGRDLPSMRGRLASLIPGEAVAWTSRRAGEAMMGEALPALRERLGNTPLYAVGSESAAPATLAGLSVHLPEEGLGAAALAETIAHRAAMDGVRRVVFLHGDRALQDLSDGLRARGIEVDELEVYRTRFLCPDLGDLQAALQDDRKIVAAFFSPSGVEAMERILPADAVERLRARTTVLARGSTTFAALDSRGYRHALCPRGKASFDSVAAGALHTVLRNEP